MKRRRDWLAIATVALGMAAAFGTGGWIATKWVSPCVCVHMQATSLN